MIEEGAISVPAAGAFCTFFFQKFFELLEGSSIIMMFI
jgi:hypothetical protein